MENQKFSSFCSFVDPIFWSQLTERKLQDLKLDERPLPLLGHYTNSAASGVPCRLMVDFDALSEKATVPGNAFVSHGTVKVFNVLSAFRDLDPVPVIRDLGMKVWESIQDGRAIADPSLLNQFLLLVHVDVKNFKYYYWFAFPALCYPDEILVESPPVSITKHFTGEQVAHIQSACVAFLRTSGVGFFLLKEINPDPTEAGQTASYQVHSDWSLLLDESVDFNQYYLVFCDPSTFQELPGWTLRNLLALFAYYRPETSVRVLAFRNRFDRGSCSCAHSSVHFLRLVKSSDKPASCPKVVGWERNAKGAFGPKATDLSNSLDPKKLSDSAVNLNLQLMRWRLVPDLDLDKLSATRCLLIGAGTLGSNIARNLLAWGISKLTFVDNGRVSYSNPARQSLYTFEDCVGQGKRKAPAAVEAVKRIHPMADVEGYDMTVHMPGHIVAESEQEEVRKEVELLESLVQKHDVLFLLSDTRESRWLPTLLAAMYKKIAICVALGFDTYVVLRHGLGLPPSSPIPGSGGDSNLNQCPRLISGDHLACYFCLDVVAPANSLVDRTLDQQCTVTRPGVSMIASAYAVELLVSLLQHPAGAMAPVSTSDDQPEGPGSPLGQVPHQMRGFLARQEQFAPSVPRFNACTACSRRVVEAYQRDGFEFLLKVFNEPKYLEEVTGLDALKETAENVEILELSDSDSA